MNKENVTIQASSPSSYEDRQPADVEEPQYLDVDAFWLNYPVMFGQTLSSNA